jgi:opacity protein-like surface antigen
MSICRNLPLCAVFGAASWASDLSAQEAYGYGPSNDWSAGAPAAAPRESIIQKAGLFHVKDGIFLQIEGASLTLGDSVVDTGNSSTLLTSDTSFGVMGTVGSIGKRGLGMEVAAGYFSSTYSGYFNENGVSGTVDTDLTLIPAFVNLRFQLGLTHNLAIEVAAGAGGAYSTATATAVSEVGDIQADASSFAAGYQGMIGISYALGNHADLLLNYRHISFPTGDSLKANSVGVGLRLRF